MRSGNVFKSMLCREGKSTAQVPTISICNGRAERGVLLLQSTHWGGEWSDLRHLRMGKAVYPSHSGRRGCRERKEEGCCCLCLQCVCVHAHCMVSKMWLVNMGQAEKCPHQENGLLLHIQNHITVFTVRWGSLVRRKGLCFAAGGSAATWRC